MTVQIPDSREGRKIIHIEPYWRGDTDAPVTVRAHLVSP